MFLVIVGMLCVVFGLVIYYLTVLFPVMRMIGMDWIAIVVVMLPFFISLYRVKKARCWHQVNGLPMWKHLIKYLRRDNECVELIGTRAYPGESFIDIPELGLMEYLGKDCYYSSGNGKFIWGIENVNFSPDPKYFNFTHLLYELGFGDSEDVVNVLNGIDLSLMGRIYLNMKVYDEAHGVKKLVNDMKEYKGKPVFFGKKKKPVEEVGESRILSGVDSIHDRIDGLVNRK